MQGFCRLSRKPSRSRYRQCSTEVVPWAARALPIFWCESTSGTSIRQNVFDRSAPEDLTFFCKSLFFLQKCGYNISVDGWFDGSWMIFLKHFSKLCQCVYPREGTATSLHFHDIEISMNAFIPARGHKQKHLHSWNIPVVEVFYVG